TEYRLPTPPDIANASHGLVRERPWTVDASGTDAAGAFCRASVMLGETPDDPWPFESRLSVEYRLEGRSLQIQAQASNLGDVPMPMGFGLHPWFSVPFSPDGTRAQHELRVPADCVWELESNLPTGKIRPVASVFDARAWRPLDD